MEPDFILLDGRPTGDVRMAVLDLIEVEGNVIKPRPPPTEFRLFRPGLNSTLKGDFLFDEEASKSVLAAAKRHGADLAIDYDHAMVGGGFFDAMDPSERGKAAGWFNLEVKDGELRAANVKWTPKAALAITNGEWRYISPAIGFDDKTRRITHVTNVAITNIPATDHPDPLRALSQTTPKKEELMFPEALLKALGLGKDATEAQVLSAILSMQVDVAALSALRSEVAVLKASVQRAETEKLSAEIEAAIVDGRVIPAQRELLNTLGKEKPEVVRQLLATAPKQVQMQAAASAPPSPAPGASVSLGEFDKHVAKLMGLKPAQMLATRKMMAEKESE